MAKRFFYVCAGLFLLAGAFALGARSVGAQSASIDAALPFYCGGDCTAAVVSRTLYRNGAPVPAPIPGTGKVIEIGTVSHERVAVILENGDSYRCESDGLSWAYMGNAIGGATPVKKSSLGQIKARYDNGGGK